MIGDVGGAVHSTGGLFADPDQPAQRLLGIEDVALPSGQLTRVLHPSTRSFDLDGMLVPGILSVLADTVCGGAAVTVTGPNERVVTTNLHLDLVSLSSPDGDVTGVGEINAVAGDAVFTRTLLSSGAGPIAHATARFAILPADSRSGGEITGSRRTSHRYAAKGEHDDGAVIEDVAPFVATMRPRLLGTRAGWSTLCFDTNADLRNDRGGLHGGIGALIGEQSIGITMRRSLPPDTLLVPIELRAAYLRPVDPRGGQVRCRARVVHTGRSFAASRAELLLPNGRPAVLVDMLHGIGRAAFPAPGTRH